MNYIFKRKTKGEHDWLANHINSIHYAAIQYSNIYESKIIKNDINKQREFKKTSKKNIPSL